MKIKKRKCQDFYCKNRILATEEYCEKCFFGYYFTVDIWLDTRGGRTVDDIKLDKRMKYVLMSNGRGGETAIYLPKQFQYDYKKEEN